MSQNLYDKYRLLFLALKDVIAESHQRIIGDAPDALFERNVNFFTKAFLINLCTYLESFLQDLAMQYVQIINTRLCSAKIPANLVMWNVSLKGQGDIKKERLQFSDFDMRQISQKVINDKLSANPYKTVELFSLLGIDLSRSPDFVRHKDLIDAVVRKRNNIVHHNDQAADVSMSDLVGYIDVFLAYMKSINLAVPPIV